jgi:hypothetical protein
MSKIEIVRIRKKFYFATIRGDAKFQKYYLA